MRWAWVWVGRLAWAGDSDPVDEDAAAVDAEPFWEGGEPDPGPKRRFTDDDCGLGERWVYEDDSALGVCGLEPDAAPDALPLDAEVVADARLGDVALADVGGDPGAVDSAPDGADAGVDAAADAAPDAAVDAAPDAAVDAAPDAAVDAAPPVYVGCDACPDGVECLELAESPGRDRVCAPACVQDADRPDGEGNTRARCDAGRCVLDCRGGLRCPAGLDCGAEGYCAVRERRRPCGFRTEDLACRFGAECLGDFDVGRPGVCADACAEDGCPAPERCVEGRCVLPCGDGCPLEMVCVDDTYCAHAPPFVDCNADGACSVGNRCLGGVRAAECELGGPCGEAFGGGTGEPSCRAAEDAQVCVLPCDRGERCPFGMVCLDGACAHPEPEPYGPCANVPLTDRQRRCADGEVCLSVDGGAGMTVCAADCGEANRCPGDPTGRRGVECVAGRCLLRCDDIGQRCPAGMACLHDRFCAWPSAYGACNDVPFVRAEGAACARRRGEADGVCRAACQAAADCPPAADGDRVACAAGGCELECADDADCPEGMACEVVADRQRCTWPLTPEWRRGDADRHGGCEGEGLCVTVQPGAHRYCAAPCFLDLECEDQPFGATALSVCLRGELALVGRCGLDCRNGTLDCPPHMRCNQSVCVPR